VQRLCNEATRPEQHSVGHQAGSSIILGFRDLEVEQETGCGGRVLPMHTVSFGVDLGTMELAAVMAVADSKLVLRGRKLQEYSQYASMLRAVTTKPYEKLLKSYFLKMYE